MAGDSNRHPSGRVDELLELAESEGAVTAERTADVPHVEELPVDGDAEWSAGERNAETPTWVNSL